MKTLDLAALVEAAPAGMGGGVDRIAAGDRVERFELAMQQVAAADGGLAPPPPAVVTPPSSVAVADGAPDPIRDSGDLILDGLSRLRGVFDRGNDRLAELSGSPVTDIQTLYDMQVEMTNFTLLVDVTSKLTGKSTQAFDTLMKGQ
ncbi:type III secretion system inner rod subunit SctI [Chthonobacter rhizosphaerae]|uniref:type III secretion system inner rod subunit SctI n=1 Tax=Chthonobacter rhizosphaerae TaxID=2735553 RepID=UPI0015EFB287|nr:type III secretion system inner rod subunit SctI [Chthonobacter rhizosphaerae]